MKYLASYLVLLLIGMSCAGHLFGGKAKAIGATLSERNAAISALY